MAEIDSFQNPASESFVFPASETERMLPGRSSCLIIRWSQPILLQFQTGAYEVGYVQTAATKSWYFQTLQTESTRPRPARPKESEQRQRLPKEN